MKLVNMMFLFIVLSFSSIVCLMWMSKFSQTSKTFVHPILNLDMNMAPETIIEQHLRNINKEIENDNNSLPQKKLHNNKKSCKLHLQQKKVDVGVGPLINLDSKRYLVAMSHNGPTNQLLGLRDAIFLSILLNRTLVLPKFFKVKTETPDGGKVVPAESRINVESLAKLIPFKQNNQLQSVCSDGIQQLVTGRECNFLDFRDRSVREVLKFLELPYPVDENGKPKFVCSKGKRSYSHILEQHDATAKCIAFSFFGLRVSESSNALQKAAKILEDFEKNKKRVNVADLDKQVIYSIGLLSTGLPSIVKKLAEAFVNEAIKRNSYLAIHWRYNPDDWMIHCKVVEKNNITDDDFSKMCNQMNHLKPKDLLHAGINVLDTAAGEKHKIKETIRAIYLATPLNQKPLIKGVEKEAVSLRRNGRTNLTVLTSTSLKSFLDKHEGCIQDKHIMKDTLALVEMQLCIQSTIFLHSIKSSWSENVLKERRGKSHVKYGEDILSLVWKQHIKKLEQTKLRIPT